MTAKFILIADADQKTVVRLEEGLAELDVQVSVAGDGAQALERALSVRQDMFLFADELPVIDTPKLVEILRNNPRTAGVPIVLLRTRQGAATYADGALTKPVLRQDAIDAVLRFAFKIGSVTEGGDKLAGSLAEIPMSDLLQLMRANKREGLLEIQGSVAGTLWLRKGEVVDARAGKAEGRKAFFRLLNLREGRFVFKTAKVLRPTVFEEPLEALILEGARQQDEIDRLGAEHPLAGRLTPLRELSALPEGLHPVHRELLLLVEFYAEAAAVVENAKVTDLEAHHGLRSLVAAGLVGVGDADLTRDGGGLRLESSLVAHLRKLSGHTARRPRPLRVAVFVSAAEVISGVNGVLAAGRWVKHQDRVLGNRLECMLSGDFSLQLDFYPPGALYTPLLGLPGGALAGGLVIASAADDKELDFLNESAGWLMAAGLPVEYLYYRQDRPESADWMRKAFGITGDAAVHQLSRTAYQPLVEAVRAVLMRRAITEGWSVEAR